MDAHYYTGSDTRDDLSARECERCGEQDATTKSHGEYVCASCARWLNNYEPGDVDREPVADLQEQQIAAMRLK